MGLQGMIDDMLARCGFDRRRARADRHRGARSRRRSARLRRVITALESGAADASLRTAIREAAARSAARRCSASPAPAARARARSPTSWCCASGSTRATACASRSCPWTRRGSRTGGALLGDRIRMNAIHGPGIFMRSLATREAGSEISAALRDVDRGVQGGRLRPRHRRDGGHRPGRRGDGAARRRVAVRDDARVRRREPAREDRHARLRRFRRDQQVRPPRGRGRAARRAQAGAAKPPGVRAGARRTCRCTGRSPRASTTTASPRCTTRCRARSAAKGLKVAARQAAAARLPRPPAASI